MKMFFNQLNVSNTRLNASKCTCKAKQAKTEARIHLFGLLLYFTITSTIFKINQYYLRETAVAQS